MQLIAASMQFIKRQGILQTMYIECTNGLYSMGYFQGVNSFFWRLDTVIVSSFTLAFFQRLDALKYSQLNIFIKTQTISAKTKSFVIHPLLSLQVGSTLNQGQHVIPKTQIRYRELPCLALTINRETLAFSHICLDITIFEWLMVDWLTSNKSPR